MRVHPIYKKNMESILLEKLPYAKLQGKHICVTGGTGSLGRFLVRTLQALNRSYDLRMHLTVLSRNQEKFQRLFGEEPDIHFVSSLTKQDLVFHLANPTDNKLFTEAPYSLIKNVLQLNTQIAKYAERNNAEIIYVSSMEVYGSPDRELVRETDCGLLDWTQMRSSYPELKRLSELFYLSLLKESRATVKILRPTLTFGTALREGDTRVYAQFIRAVLEGKDIVLHTKGQTKRDYLAIRDFTLALLILALLGKSGEIYNISNPDSYCTIRELAEKISTFGQTTVTYDIQEHHSYAPEIHIQLDNSKINKLYRFQRKSLHDMIQETVTLTKDKAIYDVC